MSTNTVTQTQIHPYLFFNGRCEEAVTFYKEALGAEVEMMMRHKDSPEPPPPGMVPAGWDNKIMHASFRIQGNLVMASDGCEAKDGFQAFSLSLALPDEDAARQAFDALSEGGRVTMPLGKTFWSPCFGMLTDQFGLGWMITVVDESKS